MKENSSFKKSGEKYRMNTTCCIKMMNKFNTKEPMDMLNLESTIERLVKINLVRLYGHVLQKNNVTKQTQQNCIASRRTF